MSSDAPGSGPTHTIYVGPDGRYTCVTTGVDRIRGETFRVADYAGNVKDDFNANSYLGVDAMHKTYTGGTDTTRYSRHDTPSGSHVHLHGHRTSTCIDEQGNRKTYQPKKDNHKCNE